MANATLFVKASPFPATPDPRRYIAIHSTEQARLRLMRSVDRDEGPAVLIGPTGTGKTLLCQTLAAAYRNSKQVVMLADAKLCTRRALLQSILFHLNLDYRARSEGELRLTLLDHLRPSDSASKRDGLLLIVDDAQSLSIKLIDELRMISGVVHDGRPRVHLILSGNMRLEERLSEPSLEVISQRIGARCYLHPLHLDETREYIREHIRRAGVAMNEVIDEAAIYAVHQAANGIPRVINQLMDQAVFTAEARGASRIDMRVIESAWAELNQLPTPYTDDERSSQPITSSAAVEFGALNDDDLDSEGSESELNTAGIDTSKSFKAVGANNTCEEPFAETELGLEDAEESTPPSACNASIKEEETVCAPSCFAPPAERSRENPQVFRNGAACSNRSELEASVLAGNQAAIAFSALDAALGAKMTPVDALGMLAIDDQGPWSFAQAAILYDLPKSAPISGDATRVNPLAVGGPALDSVVHPTASPWGTAPKSSQTSGAPADLSESRSAAKTHQVASKATKSAEQSHRAENIFFGEDFEEVLEIAEPVRIANPAVCANASKPKVSFLDDELGDENAEVIEEVIEVVDCSSQESSLHREILSIQLATAPKSPQDVSVVEEIFDLSAGTGSQLQDDRDLLVIAETVSSTPKASATKSEQPVASDYRSLFSRLRQG